MASTTQQGPIAWDVSAQLARRLLRTAPVVDRPTLQRLDEDFAWATEHAEALVADLTGLHSSAGAARGQVIDRPAWAEANIGSFERLLSPLVAQLSNDEEPTGSAARTFAGAEIAVVLSWMAKRVLGQYDLMGSGEDPVGDVVYFVGPNIVALERRHAFPPREFRLWIAVHELTHRAQFTAVPWMREHFLGLVERGFHLAVPDTKNASAAIGRVASAIREGRNPIAEGGLVSMFASPEQLEVVEQAQAFMSLLEGHGNYVMSHAGADEMPGARRFGRVLAQRRANAHGLAKFIQQLLGFDQKLRQYADGERFVDAIVQAGGDELLASMWSGPQMLPSLEEIRSPELWISRVDGSVASIA